MAITDLSKLKVGMWYAHCCHEDLSQIETGEELDDLIEENTPDEDGEIESCNHAEFWETKLDALLEIKSRPNFNTESELIEIQKMIDNEK